MFSLMYNQTTFSTASAIQTLQKALRVFSCRVAMEGEGEERGI